MLICHKTKLISLVYCALHCPESLFHFLYAVENVIVATEEKPVKSQAPKEKKSKKAKSETGEFLFLTFFSPTLVKSCQ